MGVVASQKVTGSGNLGTILKVNLKGGDLHGHDLQTRQDVLD